MQIKRVFIGNLPLDVCESDLESWLSPYGKRIGSLKIIRKLQGEISCFAYASLEMTEESWLHCRSVLNQTVFMSHRLKVEEAKPSYQILRSMEKQKEISFHAWTSKSREKQTEGVLYGYLIKNQNFIIDQTLDNWRKEWFRGAYKHAISLIRARNKYINKKRLFNLKKKKNLKKLHSEVNKKSILELTYRFDDTLNQWVNGTYDLLESRKNNVKTKSEYLLDEEINASIISEEESNNQSKQHKTKNFSVLNSIFNGDLIEEKPNEKINSNKPDYKRYDPHKINDSLESANNGDFLNIKNHFSNSTVINNLSKNLILKNTSSEVKKSFINSKNLKSIFTPKGTLDSQDTQENKFSFFKHDDSDLDNERTLDHDKKVNINIDNIHKSNKQCFTNIDSLKFPLFFPHFDHAELHAMSAFSKISNIFSREINNEEIEKNWINTRVEFTKNWKHKWKNAQKRKRRLFSKFN
ncbi:hypothetical protein PCANB_000750 [Pneumocystis canis]|nr:hypothetical protein PCANB_000750 [Pneumocystis canis]